MKNHFTLLVLFSVLLITSCKKDNSFVETGPTFSTAVDVDNKSYHCVRILGDEWFAENLSVSRFRNGDVIMEAITDSDWDYAIAHNIPAWCYYDDDSENGIKYGKMYNFAAIRDPRGLAPEGWHIATKEEWENLRDNYGGATKAGEALKSKNGWLDNGNGTNKSYFNALPGGQRYSDGDFHGMGSEIYFWTSTPVENISYQQYGALLPSINNRVNVDYFDFTYSMYVRCVKD